MWRDRYWENVVYPAYVGTHKEVFENGNNVESGNLAKNIDELVVLNMLDTSMIEI